MPNVYNSRERDVQREKLFTTTVKLYEPTVREATFNLIPKPPLQTVQEMSVCVSFFCSALSLMTHLSKLGGHNVSQNDGQRKIIKHK